MSNQRLARLIVSQKLLQNQLFGCGDVVFMKAKVNDNGTIEFLCQSPGFQEVPEGDTPPTLDMTIFERLERFGPREGNEGE